MSGYGTCKWTCGECGESYEHSGIVGDIRVDRWAHAHREQHRVEKMSPEDRQAHIMRQLGALGAWRQAG